MFLSKSYVETSEIGLECSQPMFLSTTPNINITKLFCELHSMLLLLPTAAILKGPPAAILEISVASEPKEVGNFVIQLVSSQHISFVNFQ